MNECSIVEVEDFGLNHYIHHIDEYEEDFCFLGDSNEYLDEIEEDIVWY